MRLAHKTGSIAFNPIAVPILFASLSVACVLSAQTSEWKSFGSSSEGFSALFPSSPEVNKSRVPVGGNSVELRSYVTEVGLTALYVGICDYGATGRTANPQDLLANARKGAIDHVNARLLTEKKIAIKTTEGDEAPGIQFEAENDQLHFSSRMYLSDGVLYQTMVAAPLKQPFADTAKFLDSFELVAPPAPANAPATVVADWKPYRYPADGFAISFPAQPNLEKQNVSTDAGQFELRTYVAQDSSTALIAAVCNYGPTAAGKDPSQLLESAKKGAVNNLKAHIASEKPVDLAGHRGVAFEADNDSEHISARIYLAGTVLYQSIVLSPMNARSIDTKRFLESFQFLDEDAK
jgi:hypothetical protein